MVERKGPTAPARVTVVVLPPGMCRRCVRAVSRRVSDLPGVVSLEFDVDAGVLRVGGEVDPAALGRAGLTLCPDSPNCRRAESGADCRRCR
ncbi:Heavy-metal-associated domain-containing protein [Micromonospora viridifaciens]|uniref:Heavy-metal-associated domain-containing protein n=1 Tax=Micromonospora viridifaciens TaxID=1881 RepID=A0A1C4X7G5_MICVI|nr:heavy-metal-associated domain-containing protein [Micromonospora viridifaciens]SCF04386.1 Heavy-metal-associated domain-containing protein [Micromonospora viridifaciens]